MRILFLSYSDYRFDGRLRELINISKQLGETISIVKVNNPKDKRGISISRKGIIAIFSFVLKAIIYKKKYKPNIIFVDNRMGCVPLLFIRTKGIYIIQDVRELYIISEQKNLKSKIGCIVERIIMKRAAVIIAANKYRAQLMESEFRLKGRIVIYENIRKLEYTSETNIYELKKKYDYIFSDDRKIFISTSGVDIKRTNDLLVKSVKQYENEMILLMVGGGNCKDEKVIRTIIEKQNISNVYLVDKVPADELKYLVGQSDVGIVNYGAYDTNNRLCASGKIYEFLLEGKPVITTGNKPLKEICDLFNVGVAGVNYKDSIKTMLCNYENYLKNAREFAQKYKVEDNNERLLNSIRTYL